MIKYNRHQPKFNRVQNYQKNINELFVTKMNHRLLLLALIAAASAFPSDRTSRAEDKSREDVSCSSGEFKHSGNKRELRVKCMGPTSRMIQISGFQKDKSTSEKSGFRQKFEVVKVPTFSYRYFSKISSSTGDDVENFEGARIALWEIIEVNDANAVVARLRFKDQASDAFDPLTVSKTSSNGQQYISASSKLTATPAGKDIPATVKISIFSSADDNATASGLSLQQDTLKWSLNITNWNKAAGNRMVLVHGLFSTKDNFGGQAKDDGSSLASGATRFSWATTATINGTTDVPVTVEPKVLDSTEFDELKGKDKSVTRVALVIGERAAYKDLYYDPAIGASSDTYVDSSSAIMASTSFHVLYLALMVAIFTLL